MSLGMWLALAVFSLLFTWLLLRKDQKAELPTFERFKYSHIDLTVRGQTISLHYRWVRDEKDKPLLLLIHGLGASLASWRHLIPYLKEDFHVLAIDLPGFGLSPDTYRRFGDDVTLLDELILELLNRLGLSSPITLVGNSMGAVLAVSLMEQKPEVFTHSVLINPALTPGLVWFPVYQTQWLAGPMARMVQKDFVHMLYLRTIARPESLEPEALDFASHHYIGNPESLRSFARYVRLIKNQSVRKINPRNSLFIFSDGDRVVRARHRQMIQSLYPQALTISHPSGGHQLQEDEPEWLKDQIRQFLHSHKG